MLVVFPLGLWIMALACDIAEVLTGNPMWRTLAFWNIVGGIIGALAAAIPGFLDYPGVRGRIGRIATWHMILNLAAVVLFAVNALVRSQVGVGSHLPLALSVIGVAGVLAGGWLGGEMVYVERMGVDESSHRRQDRPRRVA
jgi:uncharacterized membrane protein